MKRTSVKTLVTGIVALIATMLSSCEKNFPGSPEQAQQYIITLKSKPGKQSLPSKNSKQF